MCTWQGTSPHGTPTAHSTRTLPRRSVECPCASSGRPRPRPRPSPPPRRACRNVPRRPSGVRHSDDAWLPPLNLAPDLVVSVWDEDVGIVVSSGADDDDFVGMCRVLLRNSVQPACLRLCLPPPSRTRRRHGQSGASTPVGAHGWRRDLAQHGAPPARNARPLPVGAHACPRSTPPSSPTRALPNPRPPPGVQPQARRHRPTRRHHPAPRRRGTLPPLWYRRDAQPPLCRGQRRRAAARARRLEPTSSI